MEESHVDVHPPTDADCENSGFHLSVNCDSSVNITKTRKLVFVLHCYKNCCQNITRAG
jgi:hypothetical protein